MLFNFDKLSDVPLDDTFGLRNIAPWRNTYVVQNQVVKTPARIKSGYVLRDSNVYLAAEMGQEGGSYFFNGNTGSFISIENTQDLTMFSVNLRINMDTNAKDIQYIFSKGTGMYLYTDATNNQLKFNYDGTDYVLDTIGTYFINKDRNYISLVND